MDKYIVFIAGFIPLIFGRLPQDCHPLEDNPLDSTDPKFIFGVSSELGQKSSPRRVGNLRNIGPIPTGHFITNQIKEGPAPVILYPYQAVLSAEGVTYDAYTMDRWSNPQRTEILRGNSAWHAGEKWNKITTMGTNLKQMVSGPDGNPYGEFSGKSGVRVGIAGSGEPELTDFGDLYANMLYNGNGGSMEVPFVRGSPILSHIFKDANPVIKPFCLSNFHGTSVSFGCPLEKSAADIEHGYLSGYCTGSTLYIQLDSMTPIDVSQIQYAAHSATSWRPNMLNCDDQKCQLSNGGKRVTINIPNSYGNMQYAVNYIGKYEIPQSWRSKPYHVSCTGKKRRKSSDAKFCAICYKNRTVDVTINTGSPSIDATRIQVAMESRYVWHTATPPMRSCSVLGSSCSIYNGSLIYHRQAPSNQFSMAVNIVNTATLPNDWENNPCQMTCDGKEVCATQNGQYVPGSSPQSIDSSTVNPMHTSGNENTPGSGHHTSIQDGKRFIMELDEPGNSLPDQTRKFLVYFNEPVNFQINHADNTISFSPKAGGNYNGIMQLAYIGTGPRGDHSNDNILDSYLGTYSYKPKTSYCSSELSNTAYVNFDWKPNRDHAENVTVPLLMVTLPHHDIVFRHTNPRNLVDTVYNYTGYLGDSWLLEMELPTAPMEPDVTSIQRIISNKQQLQDVLAALNRDANDTSLLRCAVDNSLEVGKALEMYARLGSISRAFSTSHYISIDSALKSCLEKWLRIDDSLDYTRQFKYDTIWGGLFLRQTDRELLFDTDHGFPFYNDHHFQLGFFLYSLAYIVKNYPDWGQKYKASIYTLARDVGNPSYQDKFFPVARHKDMYTGFSWATGIVPGGRQQESSSQALNCYHGLAALGDAFNDEHMKHFGQILLSMEILSVREYWHVRDHNEINFPPAFRGNGVIGQITEANFYVYMLNSQCSPNIFPMLHGCIVGTQVLPVTAVSKYWMDKDWANHILKSCTDAITPTQANGYVFTDPSDMTQLGEGWKALCYTAMAQKDANHSKSAVDFIKQTTPRHMVPGSSATSLLVFICGQT